MAKRRKANSEAHLQPTATLLSSKKAACGGNPSLTSERRAERAAVICTLIQTAKLNDVDPQAWPADVLGRRCRSPACVKVMRRPLPTRRNGNPLSSSSGAPRVRLSVDPSALPR